MEKRHEPLSHYFCRRNPRRGLVVFEQFRHRRAPGATKDEAVAMVKKAVAFIETEGPAAGYQGRFVDRDLYIVV